MDLEEIKRIYAGYSNVYDYIFKWFFTPRHQHVINALKIGPNAHVLDVGVGTGLSLPLYPRHCQVVGIDLSGDMLKKAGKKVRKYGLTKVDLMEMDASRLAFQDNTFDYVVAAFVISVVPDPVRVISEMKRVAKPDGRIVIINHFQSQNPALAKFEEWVSPLCTRLGWHSDVDLEDLVTRAHLQVDSKYQLNRLDLWKVVYAHK
jgi:phosphatidylethanolamine/phosphatidyl-N-methylethanolamine N-methyltransferase